MGLSLRPNATSTQGSWSSQKWTPNQNKQIKVPDNEI